MATASNLANDGDSDEQPASDPHDSFGPHVKRLRETRRLTQEELATRAGLAADTIRRLEYNEFSPSLRTLRKVVRGLGITLTTLVSSHELAEFEIPREIIGLLATRPVAEIKMVARIWQDLAAQLDAGESSGDVQAANDDPDEKPTKDLFGSHVRRLRRARGLTQEVLAELSKISADTIRRLERGSMSPSLDTLTKVCGGLKLARSTLFQSYEEGERDVGREIVDFLLSLSQTDRELGFRMLRSLFDNLGDLGRAG